MDYFNILSEDGAWTMELDNTWCLTEYGNGWETSVASQLDCQDICLENPSCVGISYSYRAGMSNTCFLCKTSETTQYDLKLEMLFIQNY